MISEVHPSVAAHGSSAESHEWVEIQNVGHDAVSLEGWILEDTQAIAPLPDFDIAPGATALVVGRSTDIVVPAGETVIFLERPKIGSGLRDAGDRVALVDPRGVRSDAVSWGDVRWPLSLDPPHPGQSIVRTPAGGLRLSDTLTPWSSGAEVSNRPEQHRHPRPDSEMRITRSVVDPVAGESESVTIKNTSSEPLLTINWTLTVGGSLIKLRSVRIKPGASYTITDADGKLGSGLNPDGGHLVLRDPKGNWLATASWGTDETFHRLPAASPGQEIHFNPAARIHPKIPWQETLYQGERPVVSISPRATPLSAFDVTALEDRALPLALVSQEANGAGVWISEVHPAAAQGRADHEYEWFELTNSTDQVVQLDGWSIADNTSSDPLDGVIIPPRASVAIGTTEQAGPEIIVAISDGRIGNGLANAGDQLKLIDPSGEIVNAISWGNDRTYSSVKSPTATQSIHRRSPDSEPALGPPSPGELPRSFEIEAVENEAEDTSLASQSVGDESSDQSEQVPALTESLPSEQSELRITEILPAPLPGQPEWVELHNLGDQSIDLSGWAIGDSEGRTQLSGVIPARARLVITTQELEIDAPILLVDRIGNGLNNDGDTISIYNRDGTVIHQVRYGDDALPSPDRGLSIALDPERWVVTAQPTPGEEGVTPLLGDALRSAPIKPPVSDEGRLPIVESSPSGGSNAWMIVSFALIGVILTLVIRRWRPDEPERQPPAETTTYSGPPADHSPDKEETDHRESSGR